MFEGYSTKGVQGVDAASSAFAFRDEELLLAPLIQYTPAGPALDAEAQALGICGAPSFVVNGLLFWGQDRLLFVEKALNGWCPKEEASEVKKSG